MDRARGSLPSPEARFGFKPGTDRQFVNWPDIVEYFHLIGGASDRVLVEEIGKSTEGNPFLLLTISDPQNLAGLDRLREIQRRLADPRGLDPETAAALTDEGLAVVLITCSIHATEIGATQMTLDLVWELATREDEEVGRILRNVVFLLIPCLNPDGLIMVHEWYYSTLGQPWEGCRLPRLYNTYTGHDNNRDWFMFTQVETRLTIERVQNVWRPHVVFDMHQMGSDGARYIVPPFIDPIDPNVDPILQEELSAMGLAMAKELTAEGKAGVATNVIFDAYSPSRAYQHYHGGVRILSEAASCKIATPIERRAEDLKDGRGFDPKAATWFHPMPWRGGAWRLGDIVAYNKTAAYACLSHAARYRDRWVRNFYRVGQRAVTREAPPYAFLVPEAQRDPHSAIELLDTLRFADVEVERARAPFVADGVHFPAGTRVIRVAQPYGAFAKTLMEIQRYPDLRLYPGGPPKPPYDIAAHTLWLQMGVRAHQIDKPFEADLEPWPGDSAPPGGLVERPGGDLLGPGRTARGWAFGAESNRSAQMAHRLLAEGVTLYRAAQPLLAGGGELMPGAYLAPPGAAEALDRVGRELGVPVVPVESRGELDAWRLRRPRIALYRSYKPDADEGWTRWIFEQYGIAYTTVHDAEVRAGDLRDRFDVVLLTHQSAADILNGNRERERDERYPPEFCGGIGEVGAANLRAFVEASGTLVALDAASELPIKRFWLPIANALEGVPADQFYCPGSLLRILVNPNHPIGYGFEREVAAMFVGSPAFDAREGGVVARYPLHNPLLSGWILGAERLAGRAALVDLPLGRGRVVLFGFRPQFRAQARGTYRLLFNALFYGAMQRQSFRA